jgi:hypothetical protein
MIFQREQFFTGFHIPHFDGFVIIGRRQPVAIG